MYLRQFFVEGLGHASYLVGDEEAGIGAVVDPRRDVDVYFAAARAAGLALQHVLETHTHNDYVSGAKELAALSGAQLWASGANGGARLEYEFRPLREGDTVKIGGVTLRAWETPGHTPEHLVYAAFEGGVQEPAAVFTGGSLMVGNAGRTDLSGAERTEELARAQYENLRRLFALPDGVQVFPTHGGGSFCGGGGGASRWSTIGVERATNRLAPPVKRGDPESFAERLLRHLPVIPSYWRRMRPLNRRGPRPLANLGAVPGWPGLLPARPLPPEEVRDLLDGEAVHVIDTRDPAAFGGAHLPGTFGIGLEPTFGVWAGSVVPDDKPVVLVLPGGDDGASAALAAAWDDAVRQLLRAGYDRIVGYLFGGIRQWAVAGFPFQSLAQVPVHEAWSRVQQHDARVLDVRQPQEWHEDHVRGATHIPGAVLPDQLEELDRDQAWLVTCSTGYRSSVAASVLHRAGFRDVSNVLGGMSAWKATKLPVDY